MGRLSSLFHCVSTEQGKKVTKKWYSVKDYQEDLK